MSQPSEEGRIRLDLFRSPLPATALSYIEMSPAEPHSKFEAEEMWAQAVL